jgi:hypothetical protein
MLAQYSECFIAILYASILQNRENTIIFLKVIMDKRGLGDVKIAYEYFDNLTFSMNWNLNTIFHVIFKYTCCRDRRIQLLSISLIIVGELKMGGGVK